MLIIYQLIEKVSGSILDWSQEKIATHRPIRVNEDVLAKGFISIIIFILFVVFGLVTYCPDNIQDVNVKDRPVKVKVETPDREHMEYKRLKTHFSWLKKEVYDFIKIKSIEKNVDPALIMSIKQVESGNHCKNNWKCMTQVRGGSGEYGAMQVMGYHSKNPENLKNWKYNTITGIEYFRGGLEIAKGNARIAVRLYNQGHAGKWQDYKNWKYPARVMRIYKKVLTEKVMVAKI